MTLSSNDLLNEDGIAFCFNSTYDDFFIEFNIYYLDTYEANDYEYAIQRQMGKFYRTKIQNKQIVNLYFNKQTAIADTIGVVILSTAGNVFAYQGTCEGELTNCVVSREDLIIALKQEKAERINNFMYNNGIYKTTSAINSFFIVECSSSSEDCEFFFSVFYIGNEHKIPLIPNIDVLATQIGSSFTAHVGESKVHFELQSNRGNCIAQFENNVLYRTKELKGKTIYEIVEPLQREYTLKVLSEQWYSCYIKYITDNSEKNLIAGLVHVEAISKNDNIVYYNIYKSKIQFLYEFSIQVSSLDCDIQIHFSNSTYPHSKFHQINIKANDELIKERSYKIGISVVSNDQLCTVMLSGNDNINNKYGVYLIENTPHRAILSDSYSKQIYSMAYSGKFDFVHS